MAPAGASARVWSVAKDGTGDFMVIQDAVDAAADGDTIAIGAGQYEEYTIHEYAGNSWHTYAHAVSGSVTFVGEGENATYIGPLDPDAWSPGDYAVGLFFWPSIPGSKLKVSSMTIVNTMQGIYAEEGSIDIGECSFRNMMFGVWTYSGGVVESSEFDEMAQFGIIAVNIDDGVLVRLCTFMNSYSAFYMQAVAGFVVEDCIASNCRGAGTLDGSAGTVRSGTYSSTSSGLVVHGAGHYSITGNYLEGGEANIYFGLGASNVTCDGNVLVGSTRSAVIVTSCTPSINGNHVLKGGGVAVELNGFSQPPARNIDMTGNYWGTAHADSIESWIIDGNDPVTPPMNGYVIYTPYSAVPVSTEPKSYGDVKAMFR